MTNKITVDLPVLRGLLGTAAAFAHKEFDLPHLQTVELRGVGGYLMAAATDRYVAAMVRAKAEDVSGFHALIPLQHVKHLLATFKARRGGTVGGKVSLSTDGSSLLVKNTGGLAAGSYDLAVTYLLEEGQLPDLVEMFRRWQPGEGGGATAYTAGFLAKFQHVVGRTGVINLLPGKEHQPTLVLAGEDFFGAVMPCASREESPKPADWIASMSPEKVATK